jgi:hypothetical protein
MVRHDCNIHVRVSRELRNMLWSSAEARGMKPNRFVRFLMFNYLEHQGRTGDRQEVRGEREVPYA